MAARIEYQIVGRYMDGKEVTGYHLQSLDSGKSGRYTREQVAYLVGRGQITNCTGQIYQDKLLLRGVGMSLDILPVKQENGDLSRTGNIGKVRKGTSAADAMTQLMIVGTIRNGRNTVGYVLKNSAGATKKGSRADVIKLASEGRIGNARVQNSGDKVILRGVNCNLDELPVTNIKPDSGASNGSPEAKPSQHPDKVVHDINGSIEKYKKYMSEHKSAGFKPISNLSQNSHLVLTEVIKQFCIAAKAKTSEKNCVFSYEKEYAREGYFPYTIFIPFTLGGNKRGILRLDTSSLDINDMITMDADIGGEVLLESSIFTVHSPGVYSMLEDEMKELVVEMQKLR